MKAKGLSNFWPGLYSDRHFLDMLEQKQRDGAEFFRKQFLAEFTPSDERGSGRTGRQIIDAPENAVFVVTGHHMHRYTRNLAESLGRTDLMITTAESIVDNPAKILSSRREVVVDHATFSILLERNAYRTFDRLSEALAHHGDIMKRYRPKA